MRGPVTSTWFRHGAARFLLLAALVQACGGESSRTTGPTGATETVIPLTGITAAQFPAGCTGQLTATGPGPTQQVSLPPFAATLSLPAGVWTLTATVTCGGQTARGSTAVTVIPPNPVNVSIRVNARGTLTVATVGNGTVAVSPAGDACGANCHSYFIGTVVTLTATPLPGATFTGWSGGGCSGSGACRVTIGTTPTAVTATFTPLPLGTFSLTVIVTGGGTGTVTSVPPGIGCPPTCTAPYASGTAVTLTAVPAGASTFAGWSVPACGLSATCTVTITGPTAVTATFRPLRVTLAVAKTGTGAGTVTGGGINCGATCSVTVRVGTVVSLIATPNAGSVFTGWSGGGCSGTSGCTLTLTADTTVTATFELTGTIVIVNNFDDNFNGPIITGPQSLGPFAIGAGGMQTIRNVIPGNYVAQSGMYYSQASACPAFPFAVPPGGTVTITYDQAFGSPSNTCTVT